MWYKFYPLFLLSILISSEIEVSASSGVYVIQDTVSEKQVLYNGRIWRNLYYSIKGNPFLFSDKFLNGSVIMNGKLFQNLKLRYDIFNDEVMIITGNNNILQLNKDMVEGFTMEYENRSCEFSKIESESIKNLTGYTGVLYKGKTNLIVKYSKELARSDDGKIYDSFLQVNKIFVLKGDTINQIKGKKDLIRLLSDKKQRVSSYIRTNRIKISVNEPESLIAVLKFYDSLSP
jgi:hypothetical protein